MKIGDNVKCISINPLEGNTIAPPLELDKEYEILNVAIDTQGNKHLHVGLLSNYNYIRSWETGEELPNGDKVHWCHPSRFKLV